ncbi:O-acetyl-ADP-ribose deacetylase [bacterium]|nr:O-acetyl-ADP-ribose deacetylase [bacterium]MBU1153874.1 O-acetyl-ADP-ribose deacetylase [bacterium]MBU1781965.1 O-acetyl-ADP-ribose deacetylase [bacterium]MBU2599526.1 O-acetyl-ADP-ribose deacetylase [bacterium]
MKKKINNSMIKLTQGDITKEEVEIIVNAANSNLMGGGGVDGAIHRAGGPEILSECKEICHKQGKLPPGKAVATKAGNLRAKYVIHTVGPIYIDGHKGEPELLESCYRESLKLAKEKGCQVVAFPSISTGAYGYPLDEAAKIALNTIALFLKEDSFIQEVRVVLFNSEAFNTFKKALENISVI